MSASISLSRVSSRLRSSGSDQAPQGSCQANARATVVAARAISLYCNLIADAVLDGLAESSVGLGIDLGEAADIDALTEADLAAADAALAAQVSE